MLKGIMHTISSASGYAGSRSRSSKREEDNHSGRIVDVSDASKVDHDDYDEDDHDESETDRDTVEDLEIPRIPQHIDILDDGVTSTVTPVTFDFNSFAHRSYGGSGRERSNGIAVHPPNEDNPLLSKRQIGGGILCLLCIAVIAFITPFMLTRDDKRVSADASLPAFQDETSTLSSSVPTSVELIDTTSKSPSLAPMRTKRPGNARPADESEPRGTLEPPTISPSAAVVATKSPVTEAPKSATPSMAPSEMRYWMGVVWQACPNATTSMTLTCEDGYPLMVYRSTEETTKCEAVNATTQQCQLKDHNDSNDTAAALVSCPSRIRVEMPMCDDLSFVTTTTNFCDGQWRTWNSTSCAKEDQSGNATSLSVLVTGDDEQSYLSLLDDIAEFLQNIFGEKNPQELTFCYSRPKCDSNSVFCIAPPIEAEAVPQEVCSRVASNAKDEELDLAWTALDDIVALLGKK